jgi:hypothetical protein
LLGAGGVVDGNDVVVPLLGHSASCLTKPRKTTVKHGDPES